MCKDYDLFGDVIVTLDDVEFWLDNVPKHLSNSPNARIRYAKQYDVSNKIKAAKINGFFYDLKIDAENYANEPIASARFLYHPDYEQPLRSVRSEHRLSHLIGNV